MHKEFLMGNEAIAMGALAAGVNLVSGYPGTPSTEVLETVAGQRREGVYVEWSVNEKVAMEVAAGAAYSGARVMVTMKQVGLNVAADPLMSLEYVGVKGGMVILVADDPGPISSQTEQDTRHFSAFSKLPCFDPSSAQEAYEMVQEAFACSEEYGTPVFLRPTTRVCHGYASVEVKDESEYLVHKADGFLRDPGRFVIFPKFSYESHKKIEARNEVLSEVFSDYERNRIYEPSEEHRGLRRGIAVGGISFTYAMEALRETGMVKLFKVSTPHPFPERLAISFLEGLDEVLCLEELDPVIERELIFLCGKHHLGTRICGKLSRHVKNAGENTRDSVKLDVERFLYGGVQEPAGEAVTGGQPDESVTGGQPGKAVTAGQSDETGQARLPQPKLPVRPPVLCAGCPHRASFYAVKQAMKGKKSIFCGDIGCYTLGNAMPLDMVDTCLCMGAGLGIAQGVGRIDPETSCFAFVGDSTFFASAITGVVNAVYNQANMTVVILDNSTTAMTGHQPHPGTGRTVMGEVVQKVSIEAVLRGIGLTVVETVNPLDLEAAVSCVRRVSAEPGVKAIIFKSPCIAVVKPEKPLHIRAEACINCKKCIRELGCPALVLKGGKVAVDASQCTGCGLCCQVCPADAIAGGEADE